VYLDLCTVGRYYGLYCKMQLAKAVLVSVVGKKRSRIV